MELLWFSTNMVGDSFSYLIPQYVLQEYNKRLSRNDEGNFWNYYGYQYTMILDDEWILERETKAITALFTSDTGILKMETSTPLYQLRSIMNLMR